MMTQTDRRVCELCTGTGYDELFGSICGYCTGTGEWTPSPFAASGLRDAVSDPAHEHGTDGPGSGTTAAPQPTRTAWGWTKHDGAWAALAPLGATVTAGEVTLVTKAGKESTVWVTGRVLARLRFGLVVEMGDRPADAATDAPAPTAVQSGGLEGCR